MTGWPGKLRLCFKYCIFCCGYFTLCLSLGCISLLFWGLILPHWSQLMFSHWLHWNQVQGFCCKSGELLWVFIYLFIGTCERKTNCWLKFWVILLRVCNLIQNQSHQEVQEIWYKESAAAPGTTHAFRILHNNKTPQLFSPNCPPVMIAWLTIKINLFHRL